MCVYRRQYFKHMHDCLYSDRNQQDKCSVYYPVPLPHYFNAVKSRRIAIASYKLAFSAACYYSPLNNCACNPSCRSDHLQPDIGKQDSHHFECHLVSRLPQVLLLRCVPLHPKWLHHCRPTCRQWHLPHSDLPPTRHHLQDCGGGCEEGRWSRWTEGKSHGELHYWE